jgi:hypothetical protein
MESISDNRRQSSERRVRPGDIILAAVGEELVSGVNIDLALRQVRTSLGGWGNDRSHYDMFQ